MGTLHENLHAFVHYGYEM